jgi:hypothetical protein
MTNESIYEIWRPANSPWTRWVKPVVFPFLRPAAHDCDDYSIRDWRVPLCPDTAVIADLPGAESVSAGIAMARAGYRPVLVYNACPNAGFGALPSEPGDLGHTDSVSPTVVVDMSSILTALCATTKELVSLHLSEQAPPVFLLDANRCGFPAEPGWFDNRSFVASSDFPSVDYLLRHGISRVILVQPTSKPNADLLHVVVHMQRLGMTIALQAPWAPWAPRPHVFKPPMFLVSVWESLRRKFGYRRNDFDSSFGGVIPHSGG